MGRLAVASTLTMRVAIEKLVDSVSNSLGRTDEGKPLVTPDGNALGERTGVRGGIPEFAPDVLGGVKPTVAAGEPDEDISPPEQLLSQSYLTTRSLR